MADAKVIHKIKRDENEEKPLPVIEWELRKDDRGGIDLFGICETSQKCVLSLKPGGRLYLLGCAQLPGLQTDERGRIMLDT